MEIKEKNMREIAQVSEINEEKKNTIVYYAIRSNSGYEDKYPMTPSKWEFSYDVVRTFTARKSYADWYNSNYAQPQLKTCTLGELLEICPLPAEEVYDILVIKEKDLFNIYQEIKRNKNTEKEYWEIEDKYPQYKTISNTPAKDNGWYKPYTYEETNFMKFLKEKWDKDEEWGEE